MDSRITEEVSIADLFDQFIEASTMRNVLSIHHRILNYSDLNPCEFNVFFPKLKRSILTNKIRKNWKAKALFSKIDKKAAHRCYSNNKTPTPVGTRRSDNNRPYNSQEGLDDSISSQSNRGHYNNALQNYNCLVIGSGPAGLRTAIELQLLGANKVTVVEKRGRFSRNNVLHLWPFVIDDLKSLGAKKFYGKFCAGSIDHISIRQLQLILLKICLMLGCDFRDSCSYMYLCPDSIKPPTQVKNVTDSDTKLAIGSSDNTASVARTCDLKEDATDLDIFTKVLSDALEDNSQDSRGEDKNDNIVSGQAASLEEEKSLQKEESGTETNLVDNTNNEILRSLSEHTLNKQPNEAATKTQTPSDPDGKPARRGENLKGLNAHFQSEYPFQEKELHSVKWDIIIGADGRRNTLSEFFPRKEFRGRLAIAITANFINRQTPTEAAVAEISGLSFIYNQDMFNALAYDTNIQLENICYYKDDTHYFVMTAKKKSLLERGVLINDYASTKDLLADSNVNRQALFEFAKDAAYWTTGLEPLDFALNHYGQEDCAMFDFTSMYAASNACKALRSKEGGLSLVSLVGDSLLEPFWPTGSGCARGFLSSFDAAWMCRQWAVNKCAVIDHHSSISSRCGRSRLSNSSDSNRRSEPTTYDRMALSVMAERESIYRILAQTTSMNLQQNYSHWTLNPHSRYPNLNRHLVTPSQVEHLIVDRDARVISTTPTRGKFNEDLERSQRVKSPNSNRSRRSQKKLKSADASPLAKPKYSKDKLKSLNVGYKSRSRNDLDFDRTYSEFGSSYGDLTVDERDPAHYLDNRQPEWDGFDDYFVPSISGTLPSSNNLLSLEARRARDIDECLRQRRQRAQLGLVRNHLRDHFKPENQEANNPSISGNAALFGELRRLREQQARHGIENKPKDIKGPLNLLNSIRRCASFAERVKSFETKLGPSSSESTASTPKTPIDDVKNLPQFSTLQEIFTNNSHPNKDNQLKKAKMPIMKLTKDDWNVKCWEKRLAAYKQKTSRDLCGSTKSLNKALSVDSYTSNTSKPEKQVEVFKDRIKEMADKLKTARDHNQKLYSEPEKAHQKNQPELNGQAKGWVCHVRQELIKGVGSRAQNFIKPAMNPIVPKKPIKKLFEDEDEEDDIDFNKHYDHLCINKPTNKYLPKNGYTSHLTRIKYNSANSKVINRRSPSAESKQAYMAAVASQGSPAPSAPSDYSTTIAGSSYGNGKLVPESKCFLCKEAVNIADRIAIGEATMHKFCLRCGLCGITLRTNEVQHHLDNYKDKDVSEEISFQCAICKPGMRADMSKGTTAEVDGAEEMENVVDSAQTRLKSREDFLNTRINYNELYKNIIDGGKGNASADVGDGNLNSYHAAFSTVTNDLDRGFDCNQEDKVAAKVNENLKSSNLQHRSIISPSPVSVTLPLKLTEGARKIVAANEDSLNDEGYVIAKSETVDGSEQVTLILPTSDSCKLGKESETSNNSSGYNSKPHRFMIDEDELQRILHLDNPASHGKVSKSRDDKQSNTGNSAPAAGEETSDTSDDNERDEDGVLDEELSEDSSSLNSAPDIEDYDDDVDDGEGDGEMGEADEGDRKTAKLDTDYEDFLPRDGSEVPSRVEATGAQVG